MKKGDMREVTVTDASGSVSNPLTREQVFAKAKGLFAQTQGGAAETMARNVLDLANASILPRL